jgi:DNA-binding transcriptional ArsR family regulator
MPAPPTVSPALLATLFRGLADPARLSCLLVVHERPKTVGEIVEATGLSQPNVSKHLACLKDCGLLQSQRSGKYVIYRLSSDAVHEIIGAAAALLEQVGDRVAVCPTYGPGREG